MAQNNQTTDREFEAIELIALFAMSKKEIAVKWTRSVFTVETTIKNAYRKLGLKNSADATRWYFSYTFDLANAITEKQKEIMHVVLLALILNSINSVEIELPGRNTRNVRSVASEISISRLRSRRRERNDDALYLSSIVLKCLFS